MLNELTVFDPAAARLASGQDFDIVEVEKEYGRQFAVTCRTPRMFGDSVVYAVCTSTINFEFRSLRVETIDGQSFVVNDAIYPRDNVRFAVESELVGHRIIVELLARVTVAPVQAAGSSDTPVSVAQTQSVAARRVQMFQIQDVLTAVLLGSLSLTALAGAAWLAMHSGLFSV